MHGVVGEMVGAIISNLIPTAIVLAAVAGPTITTTTRRTGTTAAATGTTRQAVGTAGTIGTVTRDLAEGVAIPAITTGARLRPKERKLVEGEEPKQVLVTG